jgi:hypothetical protein
MCKRPSRKKGAKRQRVNRNQNGQQARKKADCCEWARAPGRETQRAINGCNGCKLPGAQQEVTAPSCEQSKLVSARRVLATGDAGLDRVEER